MSWFNFQFHDFAFSFLSVLFEGLPFLLLGSLLSGAVDVFVPAERLSRWMPKNSAGAIFAGGLLGLILPMCECGSVVVIRRFIKKGLPVSCAVAYMLGAPIVSPIVAISTYAAFKGQNPMLMTSLRLSIGFLIAIAVAFVVRQIPLDKLLQPKVLNDLPDRRRAGLTVSSGDTSERDFADLAGGSRFGGKLLLTVRSATSDFLDVAFFFVIGVAITSVFNTAVHRSIIDPFATNPGLAVPAMMVLAGVLALCSSTDAFIAATFTTFPFAAKLAFLLFGPVYDVKLFWLYALVFKRRWVVALGLALFITIAFICWRLSALQL
jgi:uncharacterized membrane protein YraQ (UPF0718 family)